MRDLAIRLIEVRDTMERYEAQYAEVMTPLKAEKDALNASIMAELHKRGESGAKITDVGSVTIKRTTTPRVVDEHAVIEYLQTAGIANEYTSFRLADHFGAFAKEAAKTQQEIPGLEYRTTEFVSILKQK